MQSGQSAFIAQQPERKGVNERVCVMVASCWVWCVRRDGVLADSSIHDVPIALSLGMPQS